MAKPPTTDRRGRRKMTVQDNWAYRARLKAFAAAWVARHGHDYEPSLWVDPVTRRHPCRHCDRFEGSFLHPGSPEPAPAGGEEPDHG
jgi:hypothetical protein